MFLKASVWCARLVVMSLVQFRGWFAAVADLDGVDQLLWLRYEVFTPISILPLNFLPSFFLTHQMTHGCGNFKEDRRESNGTITQSITSKMIFLFHLRLCIQHYCISACAQTTKVHV